MKLTSIESAILAAAMATLAHIPSVADAHAPCVKVRWDGDQDHLFVSYTTALYLEFYSDTSYGKGEFVITNHCSSTASVYFRTNRFGRCSELLWSPLKPEQSEMLRFRAADGVPPVEWDDLEVISYGLGGVGRQMAIEWCVGDKQHCLDEPALIFGHEEPKCHDET